MKNKTFRFFSLRVKNDVNRRSVDNRKKQIICKHYFTIKTNIMVHTTATTLHFHYDVEKPGYKGILLINKIHI